MPSPARKKPVQPRKTALRPQRQTSPEVHARQVAEAVETAWHGSYGTGRLDVPLSIVATLAAIPAHSPTTPDTTEILMSWDESMLMTLTRQIWTRVIQQRPELTHLLYPLVR
jgi:hypothetical protein